MSCYDDQLNELSAAEYEMIWTLFHADKEDKKEDCHNCEVQEGIGVRLLRFLFGNSNDFQDDCAKYTEKRPYHRHIHQPVTRTRPNTHIGPDGHPWRAEPAPETSLIPAPSLNPMDDRVSHQRGSCLDKTLPITTALMAAVMFLLSSYQLITCSSTPPAAPTYRRRPAAETPEDSED